MRIRRDRVRVPQSRHCATALASFARQRFEFRARLRQLCSSCITELQQRTAGRDASPSRASTCVTVPGTCTRITDFCTGSSTKCPDTVSCQSGKNTRQSKGIRTPRFDENLTWHSEGPFCRDRSRKQILQLFEFASEIPSTPATELGQMPIAGCIGNQRDTQTAPRRRAARNHMRPKGSNRELTASDASMA